MARRLPKLRNSPFRLPFPSFRLSELLRNRSSFSHYTEPRSLVRILNFQLPIPLFAVYKIFQGYRIQRNWDNHPSVAGVIDNSISNKYAVSLDISSCIAMHAYSRMLTDSAESRPASVTAYYSRVVFGECLRQCVQFARSTMWQVSTQDTRAIRRSVETCTWSVSSRVCARWDIHEEGSRTISQEAVLGLRSYLRPVPMFPHLPLSLRSLANTRDERSPCSLFSHHATMDKLALNASIFAEIPCCSM